MENRIWLWKKDCAPHEDDCSDQQAPSLEAYEADGARGAVIVCPGGGYTRKAPHEGAPVARVLQAAGISAFVLDYRVAPCPHEAPLEDALRAIRVVRAMGYQKVGILGFSAGGNLACCAATLYKPADSDAQDPVDRFSSRPDHLVSCYSVVSLVNYTHIGSVMALLGENYKSAELKRRYSAELDVSPDTPPAFIWHTVTDAGVPVENSVNLAGALAHAGVPFEMHLFPSGGHGMGLAATHPVACVWPEMCQRWLIDQGFGK